MKKTVLLVFLLLTNYFFAQENTIDNQNKNEFRLDAIKLIAGYEIELNYEYVHNKYSGFGAAISIGLDDNNKIGITPFYRLYFLNKKEYNARGMFVEGMLRFAYREDDSYTYSSDFEFREQTKQWFDIGAGIVIGQKWTTKDGFVFELSAGVGRYFLTPDNLIVPFMSYDDIFFIRGGLSIGYRFF